VLKKVIQYFPKYKSTAKGLEKALEKLVGSTDKNDLSLMAESYKGILSLKLAELVEEPSVMFQSKG
jgi:hypothetical protein